MNTTYDDQLQDPPEGDVLAAEYVLGVLDANARRSALQRVNTDPQFASDVAAWERHFSPWLENIAPMPVADHIWPRIQQSLGLLSPVLRTARTAPPATPSRWQDNVSVWRWISTAGFAAAAASLFALVVNVQRSQPEPASAPPIATTPAPAPAPPIASAPAPVPVPVPVPAPIPALAAPDMVAAIASDDGKAAFVASIDTLHGKIMMVPMAANIPAGKVPELWLIPPDGTPQSLGVIDPTRAHSVDIPDSMRSAFGPNALVAISLEPPGGSPTGQPTGPVIAKGGIARI